MNKMARRAAGVLIAHAARMLPDGRADWAVAMTSELDHVESDRAALQWALGCVAASYLERVKAMSAVNRVGAIAPVLMSLLAFSLVLISVTTGWERGLKDEGTAAHMFQVLIAGQLPFIAAFLITANWRRASAIAVPVAFQLGALAMAMGSVAFFRL